MSRDSGTQLRQCAFAVAVMAAALLVQLAVWPFIQPSPFLVLTLGVLIAGLHGGWAPGLLATGIGAVAVHGLFLPDSGPSPSARDLLTLSLFACVGGLVTWINVARRRGARAAIENEEWLRTTIRSIGDAVIATDSGGRVAFLNTVAEGLTGWTTAEAAGRPLRDVFHIVNDSTRREVESPVDKVLRAGHVVGLANHTLLIARDGSERIIEDSGAPIRDHDGELTGVVLVFRDTTERTRSEDRRRFVGEATAVLLGSLDYQATLATVARLLVPRLADFVTVYMLCDDQLEPLAVAHADPDKERLLLELHRLYPPRTGEGVIHRVVSEQEPQLMPRIDDAALAAGARDPGHHQLLRRIGVASAMIVPLAARGRTLGVMVFGAGSPQRAFGDLDLETAVDLARRAAIAIDNARLYRDAQEAIRLRDEFLAIASHELRTPLTTLQLQLDSLERALNRVPPEAGATLRRKLDSSSRQAVRLTNLIDSLLDVSRISTGHLALAPEPMDLVAVAAEIIERFQDQARAAGCALELRAAHPAIQVVWDRLRIEQVLSNLLSNAIKYGAGEPIELAIEREEDRVRIAIRDRGIGIPAADAERIFGRFERAVSVRNYGGLGLGLFIARQIVESHGGHIRVDASGAEPGTRLVAVLPLEVPADDLRTAAAYRQSGRMAAASCAGSSLGRMVRR